MNPIRRVLLKPSLVRSFTKTSAVRADIVKDLYLSEIKSYKAPPAEKIDLPSTFTPPKAPSKPEIEAVLATAAADAALAEEPWPAVLDTIDDPELYNDEYDISTENDDGSLFPKRLKPFDYDHGHH